MCARRAANDQIHGRSLAMQWVFVRTIVAAHKWRFDARLNAPREKMPRRVRLRTPAPSTATKRPPHPDDPDVRAPRVKMPRSRFIRD